MENETKSSKADRILEAAVDLFIAEGFESSSMDAIAEKAGVAKGTLYYHYKSKEGIVDALLDRYALRLESAFGEILEKKDLDFFGKYEAMSESLYRINRETFGRLHLMKFIDIHQKTAIITLDRLTPYFVRVIEEGAAAGVCSADHAREFSEIFLAASQYLLDPEYGSDRIAQRAEALTLLSERAFGLKEGSLPRSGQAKQLAE